MPSITIRDLPDRLHARLRERAPRHRRSLNAEIVHTLEQSTGPTLIDVKAELEELRRIRNEESVPPLTDELLREADQGRP